MDKFVNHTGIAVPLCRSNIDTDQIIPASYLKRIARSGFEDGLFAAWRKDADFILNQPAYRSGSILVVGPDFGTGSSREHAVWALQNYGFKVIIGSRFGDIFRGNAGKSGLLIAIVKPEVVDRLWEICTVQPGVQMTVDLPSRTIEAGGRRFDFSIDDYTAQRLLAGLDDIGATLQHADLIDAFEASRPAYKPTTLSGRPAE